MTIDDVRDRPTISVPEAGELLSIGRSAAYELARAGQIPTLRLGRYVRVPTAALLRMLSLEND